MFQLGFPSEVSDEDFSAAFVSIAIINLLGSIVRCSSFFVIVFDKTTIGISLSEINVGSFSFLHVHKIKNELKN